MKEQLYTIPVNDIFDKKDCECVVCAMRKKLEDDAVAFAMGPSYMEDDIRLTTDKIGFCRPHMQMMYDFENRLGLALIMDTHMKKMIEEIEKLQKKGRKTGGGLFSKSTESQVYEFTKKINNSCYICDRIKHTFERYIATVFYLYENDSAFPRKLNECKGLCLEHYGMLYEKAAESLHGNTLEEFTRAIDRVFIENYKRVEEDLSWFIDKFDYRNKEKPWKTSKDAVPRAMTKVNGIVPPQSDQE
ncbi:DUF6062 family protein [Eubacterium xylanophilum]|uniref:DUF6062 family protein n=1 Tax=Eubacterium xylanophilum TaxID=39497 RepID=UPI00047CCE1F|nr:DUF6062 family protein [Eubacterium xylanophilum]MCR5798387.1 DUF6062 family protein [Eubacterium sp.]